MGRRDLLEEIQPGIMSELTLRLRLVVILPYPYSSLAVPRLHQITGEDMNCGFPYL